MMHLKISYLSDDVSVLFMFTVRTFIITRDECIIFLRSVSDAYWFGDYTYIYILCEVENFHNGNYRCD